MQQEEQIIIYLTRLTDAVGAIGQTVTDMKERLDGIDRRLESLEHRLGGLEQRLDGLEHRLDGLEHRLGGLEQRLDGLEHRLDTVDQRIDSVESSLSKRIAEAEFALNDKLEMTEKALDTEIDKVYQIARRNEYNIEELLVPYNDRNLHVSDELERLSHSGERLDEVETVVANHSEAIYRLQAAVSGS